MYPLGLFDRLDISLHNFQLIDFFRWNKQAKPSIFSGIRFFKLFQFADEISNLRETWSGWFRCHYKIMNCNYVIITLWNFTVHITKSSQHNKIVRSSSRLSQRFRATALRTQA